MELEPLQQWICDTCGEIIAAPGDGYLEWVTDDELHARDFRIVHHKPKSPRRGPEGCYRHGKDPGRQDMHLDEFVGADGLAHLLTLLDLGQVDPDDSGPQVKSTRELAEVIRRLHVPRYEEARLYWSEATQDGYFAGANEVWPYLQDTLNGIIERYRPQPELE
jgi:hypothetical protein